MKAIVCDHCKAPIAGQVFILGQATPADLLSGSPARGTDLHPWCVAPYVLTLSLPARPS